MASDNLLPHTMFNATQRTYWTKGSIRGLSLIELLVSMAIGLVVTLAITTVLINSQAQQRTSNSLNDATQSGAHAALTLDRAARSAGSGFTQFRQAMGCVLNAGRNGTVLFPPPAALPAPFDNILAGTGIVLAPVVIVDGGGPGGSDQLVFMTGNHGFSELPKTISPTSATFNSVVVEDNLGLRANDIVLVADGQFAGAGCMLQELAAPAGVQLPMAGNFFQSVGTTTTLAAFVGAQRPAVLPLGWNNPVVGGPSNLPAFTIFGLGDNNTLVSLDLLTPAPALPDVVPVAESVVTMHALYATGLPSVSLADVESGTPQVAPAPLVWATATGALSSATLWSAPAANSLAARAIRTSIHGIKAVRVAMVLRSAVQEKPPVAPAVAVSPANLVLFPDLPTAQQVNVPLTAAEQNFRHRIVETIIPLRNL
jgi:type IV pilus assembly protein PilW